MSRAAALIATTPRDEYRDMLPMFVLDAFRRLWANQGQGDFRPLSVLSLAMEFDLGDFREYPGVAEMYEKAVRLRPQLRKAMLQYYCEHGEGGIPDLESSSVVDFVGYIHSSYEGASVHGHTLTVKIPPPNVVPTYSPVVDVWLESLDDRDLLRDLFRVAKHGGRHGQVIRLTGNSKQRDILINGLRRFFDDHPAAIQIGRLQGQGRKDFTANSAGCIVLRDRQTTPTIKPTTLELYKQLPPEDRRALHDPDVVAAHIAWMAIDPNFYAPLVYDLSPDNFPPKENHPWMKNSSKP